MDTEQQTPYDRRSAFKAVWPTFLKLLHQTLSFLRPLCNQLFWWNFSGRRDVALTLQNSREDDKFLGWFGRQSAAEEGSGRSVMEDGGGGGQSEENSFGIQHCNIAIFWSDCIVCRILGILLLQTHTEVLRQRDTKGRQWVCSSNRREGRKDILADN